VQIFVLVDYFAELVAEVLELTGGVVALEALALQGLDLFVLVLDYVVQPVDLAGDDLDLVLVLADLGDGHSQLGDLSSQELVLTEGFLGDFALLVIGCQLGG
jgi:hypothetical protein